ncbi:MAG TPA: PAS domain-containing protein [Pyrinomonadaceae bacterium]
MNAEPLSYPFGLLELDARGTVIRYSPASEQNPNVKALDVLGRDFFKDVVPVEQVGEFQNRFQTFMAQGDSIQRFTSTFPSESGQIKVQILLARITEKTEAGRERLALVRIMPEQPNASA